MLLSDHANCYAHMHTYNATDSSSSGSPITNKSTRLLEEVGDFALDLKDAQEQHAALHGGVLAV